MTSPTVAFADTSTMLRRDVLHAVRFPMLTISGLLMPVLFLLLFDGVFGHTLRAGLASAVSGGYINYVLPGILVMTAASVAEATGLGINADMGEGIIARFRTMAIWRPSVLTGQVAGSAIRTVITGALVCLFALMLGFAPHATALGWLGATGLFVLLGVALSWLTAAFGLLAKTPSGANSLALILVVLPFLSSGSCRRRPCPRESAPLPSTNRSRRSSTLFVACSPEPRSAIRARWPSAGASASQ